MSDFHINLQFVYMFLGKMWKCLFCSHSFLALPALIFCVLLLGLSLCPSFCGSPWRAQNTSCKYSSEVLNLGWREQTPHDDSPAQRKRQNDASCSLYLVGRPSPVALLESPGNEMPYRRIVYFNWHFPWGHQLFSASRLCAKLKGHCLDVCLISKGHFNKQIRPVSRPNGSNKVNKVRWLHIWPLCPSCFLCSGGCHGDSPVGGWLSCRC